MYWVTIDATVQIRAFKDACMKANGGILSVHQELSVILIVLLLGETEYVIIHLLPLPLLMLRKDIKVIIETVLVLLMNKYRVKIRYSVVLTTTSSPYFTTINVAGVELIKYDKL